MPGEESAPRPRTAGGGHWGGGLFIPTRDHARVGLLCARNGAWGDKRILSEDWIHACETPSKQHAGYGLLFISFLAILRK